MVKRQYVSPVRQEAARRTRAAIVGAATELFVARGYVGTSLSDVARAAGVARPTVTASFGSKAALLKQVLDQALAGDDQPVPVARRPWFQPVWDASTPGEALDAYAGVCALIGGRAAAVFEVVRRAADSSPELTELWNTLQENRLAGARMVVEHAQRLGALAHDTQAAVDILWTFNDPALFGALVGQRGWAVPVFTSWLATTMRNALLPSTG
ncbi:TetR/AcrR family transcriptional regulator [Actinomadura kijaniata]|uniref:TetR/AcrR family transcriptional regulator n=1 Tax=Actinomadura kijaniata TaxID=46161 RepID=UPI003F1B3F23